MQKLKIKKGYRLRIAGKPTEKLTALPNPTQVAVLPERIPHIKPKLHVAQGDVVQIGSPLFEDKRNTDIKFLSPGGGTICHIQLGPRRIIQSIVIDLDQGHESQIDFTAIELDDLAGMDSKQLVDHILAGGLWWVFRQLPFRDMPDPETVPTSILVGLGGLEPFGPSPSVYLENQFELLTYGLQVLNTLADGQVTLVTPARYHELLVQLDSSVTLSVDGNYPADDPGSVLYHTKTSSGQNRAWYISGQDLLLLAQLLAQGKYPTQRIVTVAGSAAPVRRHFVTRLGVPLAHLIDMTTLNGQVRYVVGGLFRGYAGGRDEFMGIYETALNLVPEGQQAEFLALFNPGMGKPTYSRTFLSRLNPGQLIYNCNLNGGERTCIACMHCADVCPVDILPQMAYKAILAEEIEDALELGLLDCVECGLCSYVCPSKIELSQTFVAAKAAYAKDSIHS